MSNRSSLGGVYTSKPTYDSDGRILTVVENGVLLASATYDGVELASVAYGNGTSIASVKDMFGRDSRLHLGLSGRSVVENVTYSRSGRVTATGFADRLIATNAAASGGMAPGDGPLGSSVGTGGVVYDSRGNMVELAGVKFAYDTTDQHIATVAGDGSRVEYLRDGGGIIERTSIDADGVSLVARYTAGGLVLDGNNAVVERVLSLPGGVLLTERPAGGLRACGRTPICTATSLSRQTWLAWRPRIWSVTI